MLEQLLICGPNGRVTMNRCAPSQVHMRRVFIILYYPVSDQVRTGSVCSCRNESQALKGSGYPLLNNVDQNEPHTYIACRVGCTHVNTHTNLARALWDSMVRSSLRTFCHALLATCSAVSIIRPKLVTRHGYEANIRFGCIASYGSYGFRKHIDGLQGITTDTTIPITQHCAAPRRSGLESARTHARTPPRPAQRSANYLL